LSIAVVWENVKYFHGFFCKLVTVQPTASLLWNPTHKGLKIGKAAEKESSPFKVC